MKNRKFIKALGSTVLTASLCITGCSVAAQEETTTTTEKETTTTETTEDECDPCGCTVDEDDEMYYSSYSFQSTNGELEGQMDYMVLVPCDADINWDNYPENDEDMYITDASSIADEDIRALAQTYIDLGYDVTDPDFDQEFGFAWGDGEYMFTTGFTAYGQDGDIYSSVWAYKMNETLFDYYFVEWNEVDDTVPVTDDGTVIRYGDDDNYMEFNRDTGVGVMYYSCDSSEAMG